MHSENMSLDINSYSVFCLFNCDSEATFRVRGMLGREQFL